MNRTGKGNAIAGIWIGVGIASFSPAVSGAGLLILAPCAFLATVFTVLFF